MFSSLLLVLLLDFLKKGRKGPCNSAIVVVVWSVVCWSYFGFGFFAEYEYEYEWMRLP
jgi:hypothetical protein